MAIGTGVPSELLHDKEATATPILALLLLLLFTLLLELVLLLLVSLLQGSLAAAVCTRHALARSTTQSYCQQQGCSYHGLCYGLPRRPAAACARTTWGPTSS
jgi:hypothetical protein